jgi:hypothetical protein
MAAFSTFVNRLKYERQLQLPDHAENSYSQAAQLGLDAIPFDAVRSLQPPDTPKTRPANHLDHLKSVI